mmetsp:Transcript_60347/g.111963  ORF Transcript_60347/g.111963 Transcript_60347/m.111963 type:complete len:446 (+) Transcript_60347:124-1461(+)
MHLSLVLACLLPYEVLALSTKVIPDASLPLATAAEGKYDVVFTSSPTSKQVSYGILQDEALVGKVHPLVKTGLEAPHGIAVDTDNGALFVTDALAKKIYRYPLGAQACSAPDCAHPYLVKVSGTRVEVLENVESKWVALDSAGNLYYTDQADGAQSVNMLSHALIEQIVRGVKSASSVSKTSEKDGLTLANAENAKHLRHPVAAVAATNHHHSSDAAGILTLYETGVDDHVTVPEGVAVSGDHVFWANRRESDDDSSEETNASSTSSDSLDSSGSLISNGDSSSMLSLLSTSAGSVGEVARGWTSFTKEVQDKKDAESTVVAATEAAPKGLTKTTNMLFFTTEKNSLYAVTAAGETVQLTDTFDEPRAVVWDGIGSLFIADQGKGAIYTVPSGEAKKNRPVKKIFDSPGSFGVAVVSKTTANASPHHSGATSTDHDCWFFFCGWP